MVAVSIPEGIPDAPLDLLSAILRDTSPPVQTWLGGVPVEMSA